MQQSIALPPTLHTASSARFPFSHLLSHKGRFLRHKNRKPYRSEEWTHARSRYLSTSQRKRGARLGDQNAGSSAGGMRGTTGTCRLTTPAAKEGVMSDKIDRRDDVNPNEGLHKYGDV